MKSIVITALILISLVAGFLFYSNYHYKSQVAAYLSDPHAGDLVLIEGRDNQFVVAKVTALDSERVVVDLGKHVYPNLRTAVKHVKDASGPDYFSDEQMEMPRSRYTAENIQHVERPEN